MTITPLRRVAVTLAMTGVTAFGAVAVAPAAFADEPATVTEGAAEVIVPEAVVPEVVVPEVAVPAAPPVVVAPPPVVIGKDGKPVQAPKVCTDNDVAEYQATLAKATAQAAPLTRAADKLRETSAALRAQVAKLTPSRARAAQALASLSDVAASRLEAQAQAVIARVAPLGCIVVTAPGGRF